MLGEHSGMGMGFPRINLVSEYNGGAMRRTRRRRASRDCGTRTPPVQTTRREILPLALREQRPARSGIFAFGAALVAAC